MSALTLALALAPLGALLALVVWRRTAREKRPWPEDRSEELEREIQQRRERIGYLSYRLRQIANELNDIVARIEDDDPVLLPERQRRMKERS